MRFSADVGEFSWRWVGRISALIGIPAGLIAILIFIFQPNRDCDRIGSQMEQTKSELTSAEGQLLEAELNVSKQEQLVDFLAGYLDDVRIDGDALVQRRLELDRELRHLNVVRDRVATVSDRVSDTRSDHSRLQADFRSLRCET